jgi:hypothetical protein
VEEDETEFAAADADADAAALINAGDAADAGVDSEPPNKAHTSSRVAGFCM